MIDFLYRKIGGRHEQAKGYQTQGYQWVGRDGRGYEMEWVRMTPQHKEHARRKAFEFIERWNLEKGRGW